MGVISDLIDRPWYNYAETAGAGAASGTTNARQVSADTDRSGYVTYEEAVVSAERTSCP
jgi:hypothetical protein